MAPVLLSTGQYFLLICQELPPSSIHVVTVCSQVPSPSGMPPRSCELLQHVMMQAACHQSGLHPQSAVTDAEALTSKSRRRPNTLLHALHGRVRRERRAAHDAGGRVVAAQGAAKAAEARSGPRHAAAPG